MKQSAIACLSLLLVVSCYCCAQPGAGTAEEQIKLPETRSIVEVLKANDHLSIERQIELYRRLKKEQPEAYTFWNEDELTMYGYGLLWNNQTKDALAIFKLLIDEFPESANTYDSAGEAYLALGDTERSLANYRKALAMNPDNFYAEDQIHRILHPEDIPETEQEKFAKVYPVAAYREDLEQMAERLLKVHPNALKFISEEDFRTLIDRKKALMTEETTYAEFRWHCAEIIASLNCSHTSLGRFSTESSMLPVSLRFPLQTRLVGEQLFVVDPLENADQLAQKDEITHINGMPVGEIVQKIYRRIPSQGYIETTKRHEFNTWATGMIPFALNFPETYQVTLKGAKDPLQLVPTATVRNHFTNPAIKPCPDGLCFELAPDGRVGVLTISTFNFYSWNNLEVFMKFMDETFTEIAENAVEHLVIDLRGNGGGSMESSIYLLRYLHNEPFQYSSRAEPVAEGEEVAAAKMQEPFEHVFTGKSYFLIDGLGNSTTGHFMSLVKIWQLGTIVGEELGSNQFCSAGQEVCRLSNTKILYYVANNTHVTTATSLPDEQGILPDHFVSQSIDDYLDGVDTVMDFVLALTKQ